MGLRWDFAEDCDIKLSGALAKVAMDLGFLTRSKEYPDCFEDSECVRFDRSQVNQIVEAMLKLYPDLDELDIFKLDTLDDWLNDSEENEIIFC